MALETNSQLDPRRTRPIVGWFTNNLVDMQQVTFWRYLSQAAHNQNIKLICYCSDVETYAARIIQEGSRAPLELARAVVDGLIVPDVALRYMPFLAEFLQESDTAPAICVMSPLPGKPAVLVDNYSGVRQLMGHLIETHHYRCIGFVGLNSQSYNDIERFQSYQAILAEYDLPFRPELVEPDQYHYSERGYERSVSLLLEERGLRPGVDLEAVVCSNDWTAMHVIRALQARGLHVPEDLAVVGCDDLEHDRQVLPRLTSVQMPIEQLTTRAVELILAQLRGEAVPDTVVFPFGTLVVRESCGCAPSIRMLRGRPTSLVARGWLVYWRPPLKAVTNKTGDNF
jgi:DNA-binding LacI/PurR family transcriptional regulator